MAFCYECYKNCKKGEYKIITNIKKVVRKDFPSMCYMNLKSYEETPQFYEDKKERISYCLECFETKK